MDGVGIPWTERLWALGNVLLALLTCGVCKVLLESSYGWGVDDVLGEKIVDGDEGAE